MWIFNKCQWCGALNNMDHTGKIFRKTDNTLESEYEKIYGKIKGNSLNHRQ